MRIHKRMRKKCVVCGNTNFPPVYALQHFYTGKGRGSANKVVRVNEKTAQVVTRGWVCYRCVTEYFPRAEVTHGYRATKARLLELVASASDDQLFRTALFYEPLWYVRPEFWDI